MNSRFSKGLKKEASYEYGRVMNSEDLDNIHDAQQMTAMFGVPVAEIFASSGVKTNVSAVIPTDRESTKDR